MSTGSGARVRHLDGLRGLAIIYVVAQHWWGERYGYGGGTIGVDEFFVLSGFIVTTILAGSSAGYVTFLRRRAWRLVPPLVAAVAGGVVLVAVVPVSAVPTGVALRSAFFALTQTSSPAFAVGRDLRPFGVTWSLAVEWYFYLLWPVVVLRWRRRGADPARCARRTAVLAAVLFAVSLSFSPSWFYFGPVSRFGELLAGAALAYGVMAWGGAPRWCPPAWVALAGIAASTLWVAVGPHQETPWYRFVGVPLAVATTVAVIVVGIARPGAAVVRMLSTPLLVRLGLVSYTLYLWHTIPWILLTERSTGLPYVALLPIIAASTVLLTAAAHRWVERPCLQAGRSPGQFRVTAVFRRAKASS